MLILSGADVVLPTGTSGPSSVLVHDGRIADIVAGDVSGGPGDERLDLHGHLVAPGFVDVHVHGAEGRDVLDGNGSVARVAASLPQFGVTSFCPTTVACPPAALARLLAEIRVLRADRPPASARVLPAHLESNFINPGYRGAQPEAMLRSAGCCAGHGATHFAESAGSGASFSADEILAVIERAGADVGIVTLAPEIDGGVDLVRRLVAAGRRVSLGHSGAGYELSREAFAAGACHATHLFNRMPPLGHREPGLVGAVLDEERIAPEVICDARHVHPAMVRTVVAVKGPDGVIAITDGTSGAGLPDGSRALLGDRPITVRDGAAYLDDGTLAGSALTFDAAFRVLVKRVGLDIDVAVRLCASTPAREMGLVDRGRIEPGLLADLVVFDAHLAVAHTIVGGAVAYSRK